MKLNPYDVLRQCNEFFEMSIDALPTELGIKEHAMLTWENVKRALDAEEKGKKR